MKLLEMAVRTPRLIFLDTDDDEVIEFTKWETARVQDATVTQEDEEQHGV